MTTTADVAKLVELLAGYGVRLGRPDLREKLAARLAEEGLAADDLRMLGEAIFETERAVLDKAALLASILQHRERWSNTVAELREVKAREERRRSKRQTKAERKAEELSDREAARRKAQDEQDALLAQQYGMSVEEFKTFQVGRALHAENRAHEDPDAVEFYLEAMREPGPDLERK